MPLAKKVLIKQCMKNSNQALATAYDCINKDLIAANNRIYYSIFYIVTALSYMDDFTSTSHHNLMGWFNKKYIHENKIFNSKLNKIYTQLIKNREKFDYNIAEYPDKDCTIQDLEDAKFFVKTVLDYIKSQIDIN